MAELFKITLDVGSDEPVETVTGLVTAIQAVTQSAFDIATRAAERIVSQVSAARGLRGGPDGTPLTIRESAEWQRALQVLAERHRAALDRIEGELADLQGTLQRALDRNQAEMQRTLQEISNQEPPWLVPQIPEREPAMLEDAQRRWPMIRGRALEYEYTAAQAAAEARAEELQQQEAALEQAVEDRADSEMTELADAFDRLFSVDLRLSPAQVRAALPYLIQLAASEGRPPPGDAAEPGTGHVRELAETAIDILVPNQPYRFRSLHYQNPLTVEILSAATGFLTSRTLPSLLKVIRDWSADRRKSIAAASDDENTLAVRTVLRQQLLAKLQDGEVTLPPDMVGELLTRPMSDDIDRLAKYPLTVEQYEIPDS